METISIFGLTGQTGTVLSHMAVAEGFTVRALCRTPPAPGTVPASVRIILGQLTDQATMSQAIAGSNAVICVFGPRPPYTPVFCGTATRTIIQAMREWDVQRLICVTGALIGPYPRRRSWFMRAIKALFAAQQPAVARDREAQEQAIAASDRAWTIVKPPRLTNGPGRQQFRRGENLKVTAFAQISRADLSHFLLELVRQPGYLQQRVVIRY
jgi:putative NADH-flavin reductase